MPPALGPAVSIRNQSLTSVRWGAPSIEPGANVPTLSHRAIERFIKGTTTMTRDQAAAADHKGWLADVARISGAPLRLLRGSRRRFRRFLAFSTIDPHTLDDIGVRRSIFTAAPSDDCLHGMAACSRH